MEKVLINLDHIQAEVDPKIFGHFTEHAFRNIYGGIYDPSSAFANEKGMREDVLEALRRVGTPLLRYPGGNFVSNYHWEDGIGPKTDRKRVFEYAWKTEESNQFGTADFIELCRAINAEPLLCVNMGTGTVEEAMHWVEYCNGTGNTYYANLRRQHGYEEPFHVKYWGLGNEMYGMWQMNHKSAADYGTMALEFAKAMKWVDPEISLIACGFEQSSDWNYEVTKKVGALVDYISAHHYSVGWGPFERDDYMSSLYIPEYMERLTELTLSAVNTGMNDVCGKIKVAWDEWNYFGWIFDGVEEDASYTLHNAIVTALILNMFIRNSNKIGMANYSTFVNINGALSTHEKGIVKRPQYHVFDLIGNHTGQQSYEVLVSGEELEIGVTQSGNLGREPLGLDLTGPETAKKSSVRIKAIDCAATGTADGKIYLSLVNKDPERDLETELIFYGLEDYEVVESSTIYHESLSAANTEKEPEQVMIRQGELPQKDGRKLTVLLKKHSVNLIELIRR